MRHMKKLAAVLLAAVMALTLLTACGGGGGGSSRGMGGVFNFTAAELTQKLNTDLKSNARYDSNLGTRFATAMNAAMSATAGLTKEEAEQVAESIMTSAGFANSYCATTVIEKNSKVEEWQLLYALYRNSVKSLLTKAAVQCKSCVAAFAVPENT